MLAIVMFIYITCVYLVWVIAASKFGRSTMFDIAIVVLGGWGFFEVAGRFV